jgi:hypothetical protein
MPAEHEQRIRDFLALSLDLWRVEGRIDAIAAPGVAAVVLEDRDLRLDLVRGGAQDPFRWYLRHGRRAAFDVPGGEVAMRPCGSLLGALAGMRRILGVDAGGAVRIARGPA